MFGEPDRGAPHRALHGLPILFIVFNNGMWNAVRRSTLAIYPDGATAKSNKPPLIHLDELPAFEQICVAAGGYGERVEDPADLPVALAARHQDRHRGNAATSSST